MKFQVRSDTYLFENTCDKCGKSVFNHKKFLLIIFKEPKLDYYATCLDCAKQLLIELKLELNENLKVLK